MTEPLPIEGALPAICSQLLTNGRVIIRAEPGAGKTTRVPEALLEHVLGTVLVIEPRRLAARLSAQHIAQRRGEEAGQTVGYQMRFEQAIGKSTRLRFITEGLFNKLLLNDPQLQEVSVVVIDEFHERHIASDLALALVKQLQRSSRPDLKLVVMSATLDTEPLAAYLDAEVFDVPGRSFPVDTHHLEGLEDDAPIETKVARGLQWLQQRPDANGDVLVFLTGLGEILRVKERLQGSYQQYLFCPLSAEVSRGEQNQVFSPSKKPKVILATNVAETSITLPEVGAVLDSGRAKHASLAVWSGLTSLDIKRIPKASCIQRGGRAGRTRAGLCLRLFSQADFHRRDPFAVAEIRRLDLCSTLLEVLSFQHHTGNQAKGLRGLDLYEKPEEQQLAACEEILHIIGAIDANLNLTPSGQKMAALPVHPRLAAMVVKGQQLGHPAEAVVAAGIIDSGGIIRGNSLAEEQGRCDVRYSIRLRELHSQSQLTPQQQRQFDSKRFQRSQLVINQLTRRLKIPKNPSTQIQKIEAETFSKILLQGFGDRIAVSRPQTKGRRRQQIQAYNLCRGRGGQLSEASVIRGEKFILALLAEETQRTRSAAAGTSIYMASGVSSKALIAYESPLRKETTQLSWDKKKQEVKKLLVVSHGSITVGEATTPLAKADLEEASHLLQQALHQNWPQAFSDHEFLSQYHNRLNLLSSVGISHPFPHFEGEMLQLLLETLCSGHSQMAGVTDSSLRDIIYQQFSEADRHTLSSLAPESWTIPKTKRRLTIVYPEGSQPFIASRLQDFLGVTQHPLIADGKVKLVIQLLAPNQRPLQITDDLPRFWQGSYQQVRKEMRQRYPKHHWPENPTG